MQSRTLSCPCSKISINYARLLDVQYSMHHLCRSVFVTERFRSDFFPTKSNGILYYRDLRLLGGHTFQSLSMFCQMMERSITEGLTSLYDSQYVSVAVTSAELFQSATRAVFDQFLSSTTNDLLSTLRTIRDINHANALFSGRFTNYALTSLVSSWRTDIEFLKPVPWTYSGCICNRSSTCIEQASIYTDDTFIAVYDVPGLYIGCAMTEAVLQSTLGCFYDQTCLGQFLSYLEGNSSIDVTVLDRSSLIRFSVQSTIQELVDNLMVEQWNFSTSFDNYYHACRPVDCTYTDVTKNDAIDIVTTLFGLVGGLSTILAAVIPLCIKAMVYLLRKCSRQVTQVVPVTWSWSMSRVRFLSACDDKGEHFLLA